MKDNPIVAVGVAIINRDQKFLVAKRTADKPMPNKWEFPGGKLEKNETLQECGIRETKEELELDIKIEGYLGFENIHYKNKDFQLHLFTARLKDENQIFVLNEHSEAKWLGFEEFKEYDFPASKLKFVQELKKTLVL